ncbi:alkylation response protein AidB-like acyl-CoA dehydrogenase [Actinocorallia herbida]|uniref:Alkylation response protein AidB-like acyl-CoA dehydrogenase n=1 Tax=Actinocorallia herbida TaxID=58109 RepID=A0A3N1D1W0_9ACTN|nr:acyl-CoA dehydrogenase family protein [Actinocorallia herbida]ROO87486.1 alkylation response protein AidB-like acyl-CoA dehydrogenase [Actinocorallia herbida]
MDFEPTEEQATLREVSRSMLAAACPPALVRALAESGGDVDDKLWRRGAELGWTGLAVPEEHEGAGQGLVELCLVAEELGRAVAPGPFVDTALTASVLSRSDSPKAAEAVRGLTARGQKASLVHHGRVSAARAPHGLVLNGRATAVHSAGSADWFLVVADFESDAARLVLLEAAAAEPERRRTLDETRGWYDVVFDDVFVPSAQVVSADPAEIRRLLDAAAVVTAADALGVGERLLEMTVDYVKVRKQFDRQLGSFQSVKHKVADMLTTLKGARAAIYYAAMALDAGVPDASLASSAAKAFTGEGISALAGEALQTHGGIGFTWEHDLHLYLRRAKVDELLYGSTSEHHERVLSLIV